MALSADAWYAQMLFPAQREYRVVAHDRRGHGRSGQSWQGNNMDQYADDLAELMNYLDLEDATMVQLERPRQTALLDAAADDHGVRAHDVNQLIAPSALESQPPPPTGHAKFPLGPATWAPGF